MISSSEIDAKIAAAVFFFSGSTIILHLIFFVSFFIRSKKFSLVEKVIVSKSVPVTL